MVMMEVIMKSLLMLCQLLPHPPFVHRKSIRTLHTHLQHSSYLCDLISSDNIPIYLVSFFFFFLFFYARLSRLSPSQPLKQCIMCSPDHLLFIISFFFFFSFFFNVLLAYLGQAFNDMMNM